jgi:hypothetical protein
MDLGQLKQTDLDTKPPRLDEESIRLWRYYTDQGRDDTVKRLRELGLGLRGNLRPIEVSLLRRVVDRLAVIYDHAPTRWLARPSGKRYAETSSEHIAMIEVLRRAQYNLAWRLVDRTRALLRQAVIRFYPSDVRGSVVLRVFEPHNVLRAPDAASPDTMDTDAAFALRLASAGDTELWELWERNGEAWTARRVDGAGHPSGAQPFGASGVCPYTLPVQIVYDDYPGGSAWLAPRSSRLAWVEALNALGNDLWNLVVHEAHSTLAVATDSTEEVPSEHGPGKVWALPRDATASVLSGNPKISESENVLNNFVRLWTLSEDLPIAEFDDAKQVVTGAALRVQQAPLHARREAQVALAEEDERQAWRRLRGVHNLHTSLAPAGSAWTQPLLAEAADLEVEIAEMAVPTDARELLEAAGKSLVLGTLSMIDVIQRQHNVGRADAIKIYERLRSDREEYPSATPTPGEVQDGPRVAEDGRADAQVELEVPEPDERFASVTDAIQAS